MCENRETSDLKNNSETECFQDNNTDSWNSTWTVDWETIPNISKPVQGFEMTNINNYVEDYVKSFVKTEYQKQETNFFTLFGIYASMVAFLSIEVQIFKTINNINSIVGFSFILLWSLLFFVLISDYLIKGHNISSSSSDFSSKDFFKSKFAVLLISDILILLIGILFVVHWNNNIRNSSNFHNYSVWNIYSEFFDF